MSAQNTNRSMKVLCVDDEPHILAGLTRHLRMAFTVLTAENGPAALEIMEQQGPFALTISDMRMPQMTGAVYLARAKQLAPDTVRILLTGQTDFNSAIAAINEGQIFRFLTKPCPPPVLLEAATAAVQQYRLINAERELLQNTLLGSVAVLTEVLGLVKPLVFERATRVKLIARQMAAKLAMPDAWQCELAALLLHLGYLGFPDELLQQVFSGKKPSAEEHTALNAVPGAAHALVEHIPRIETVLKMLGGLEVEPTPPSGDARDAAHAVNWGVHLIQLSCRYDALSLGGKTPERALERLQTDTRFAPAALETLVGSLPEPTWVNRKVKAKELDVSMVIDQDVRTSAGLLLVKSGQHVTPTVIKLLQRMSERNNLCEPIDVKC